MNVQGQACVHMVAVSIWTEGTDVSVSVDSVLHPTVELV